MPETYCYFEISLNNRELGRIVFKLFEDNCPKTSENFRCLCTGERGKSKKTGKQLHYKDTCFHRIVKDFILQGGDITDGDGKGGDSIYNGSFADENLTLKHDKPYLLSMANRGPDTNGSQFFITTRQAPHLDGKHVIFGEVIYGFDLIKKLERVEVDSRSKPLKEVKINDCGQLSVEDGQKIEGNRSRPRKRKLSVSSHDSAEPRVRRHHSRSSCSSSCSSSSSRSYSKSSCSSASSERSRSRTPTRKKHLRKIRGDGGNRGSSSSSSDDGSSTSSSSGSNSDSSRGSSRDGSGGSISSSSDSDSSCTSGRRGRRATKREHGEVGHKLSESDDGSDSDQMGSKKRHRGNRRLLPSDDFKASTGPIDDARQAESSKLNNDEYINPRYKCSVKLDEIPEIPVNRFLMRESPTESNRKRLHSASSSNDEYVPPIEVDLSKFEDIPDQDKEVDQGIIVSQTNVLKSQVKPTEPLVSKSGRIMKGRGTFKFRTPSPDQDDRYRKSDRSRTPYRYSSRYREQDYRSRRDYERSRRYDR